MNDIPLVTVAVIAYKAADYVLETLESIKAQTYQNIELIVTDDASPDDTALLCEKWLKENCFRFVRAELISNQTNGGVTVNSNRALNAARGEWFKMIGSDDVLYPDAIEKMIHYLNQHPEANFLFGKQIFFNDDINNVLSYREEGCWLRKTCFRESVTAADQFRVITKNFFGCAASSIGKTSILREIGGFDERWPIEDWPLYINLTKSGHRIFYVEEVLVYRRVHSESIMNKREDGNILSNIEVKSILGGHDFLYENSNYIWKKLYTFSQWLNYGIVKNGNNSKSLKCRFWRFLARWFDPYNYYFVWLIIKEKTLRLFS